MSPGIRRSGRARRARSCARIGTGSPPGHRSSRQRRRRGAQAFEIFLAHGGKLEGARDRAAVGRGGCGLCAPVHREPGGAARGLGGPPAHGRRPIAAQVVLYCGRTAYTWKTAFDALRQVFARRLADRQDHGGAVSRRDRRNRILLAGRSFMAQPVGGAPPTLDSWWIWTRILIVGGQRTLTWRAAQRSAGHSHEGGRRPPAWEAGPVTASVEALLTAPGWSSRWSCGLRGRGAPSGRPSADISG